MLEWDTKGEAVEATWTEWCSFYRAFFKKISISEFDKEEKPSFYTYGGVRSAAARGLVPAPFFTFKSPKVRKAAKDEDSDSEEESEDESEDESEEDKEEDKPEAEDKAEDSGSENDYSEPLTFLSCYFLQTRKGTAHCIFFVFSNCF